LLQLVECYCWPLVSYKLSICVPHVFSANALSADEHVCTEICIIVDKGSMILFDFIFRTGYSTEVLRIVKSVCLM
jgi:hypothetical protein